MSQVQANSVNLSNTTYHNNQTIINVDLNNVAWVGNSMANAFGNCTNLNCVENINENIIDMYYTFYACKNLVSAPKIPNSVTNMTSTFYSCSKLVNAPVIPNSVTNMFQTFYWCRNLVNAPVIPNSVTAMGWTFSSCSNLVNPPEIPNSVTDMSITFDGCYNLANAPVIPNSVTSMRYTFRSCRNFVNAPVIPNSVTDMGYTFQDCANLSGDVIIKSEIITSALNCFYGTSLDKNVYIPFEYGNGVATSTCNSFINAGYSTTERVNGVLLYDLYLKDWRYETQSNGVRRLYEYLGSETNIVVPNRKTQIGSGEYGGPFASVMPFVSVDLNYVPFENNDMKLAFSQDNELIEVLHINENVTSMCDTFYECTNLVNAPVLPNNLINMYGTFSSTPIRTAPIIPNSVIDISRAFAGCWNLVNAPIIPNSVTNISGTFHYCSNLVNAPTIPDSVTDMSATFSSCSNLVNAPIIPDSVIDMRETFQDCTNLVNAPVISNSVTNMSSTFDECTNLVNAPTTPNSVTNMWITFQSCSNLTGNIYIESEIVNNATNCFYNTSLDKDVYIPFQNNGVYTATYNAFKAAGYSEKTRNLHGVLLMDINSQDIDLSDYKFEDNAGYIRLYNYIGEGGDIITPHLV